MTTWRLIRSGHLAGAMNMALDDALLQSVAAGASPPVLRLYRWRPATVTIGYAQSVASDINLDACRQAGLDVVRRPTGGRAVLHDQELTYAVIASTQEGCLRGSVLDCYRAIAEVLCATVRQLGVAAELVPGQRRGPGRDPIKAVCFSAPSQYELVVEGRKVAGSAQKRQGSCFLQHGSLPAAMDLDLLGRILPGAVDLSPAQRFGSVGWLNRWTARPLVIEEMEDLLIETFAQLLGIEWSVDEPTAAELQLAGQLCQDRYLNPAWTFRGESRGSVPAGLVD